MSLLDWLLHGTIPVGDGALRVPEVVGNVFGLLSAILGMKRLVWAWPVGLVGNALLFTVFASGELSGAATEPLWGQAGRQVFFAAMAVYGWWRWTSVRRAGGASDGGAIAPRWATWAERAQLLVLGVVGYAIAYAVLLKIGSWGPTTEAWILAGSMLATYGMARGWVDFWIVWMLVDVVGVTTLIQAGYYPTAGMYLFYAVFVVIVFVWWRQRNVCRRRRAHPGGSGGMSVRLDPVERAVADIAAGKAVVVVDDEDRENEGDIIFAASKATPELMAFTIRHSSGVICAPMPAELLDRLEIPLMTPHNKDAYRTAYTISVDARDGVSTGISAADRARTVRTLADSATEPWEVTRPGHVFPLRYREGGVLVRRGHTEAAVDLCRLAGLTPVGVLVEVVNDDGTMKRGPELREFADEHGLAMISIEDLVRHRRRHERHVERVAETRLPTAYGDFTAYGYRDHHRRLRARGTGVRRPLDACRSSPVLTRVHSECLTGDVFGSGRCDCGPQLQESMRLIVAEAAACSSTCAGTRGAASACCTSCRPTSCRTRARTPSTPTSTSGCRPTPGTTAPPPRCCETWASSRCGCSPTTPTRPRPWRTSASAWSSACR